MSSAWPKALALADDCERAPHGLARWLRRRISFNMQAMSHFRDRSKVIMAITLISRRLAVLSLVGAFSGLGPVLAGEAAVPAQIFRAVEVDVSPLRRAGDRASAEMMVEDLPALLNRSLAAYLAPATGGLLSFASGSTA